MQNLAQATRRDPAPIFVHQTGTPPILTLPQRQPCHRKPGHLCDLVQQPFDGSAICDHCVKIRDPADWSRAQQKCISCHAEFWGPFPDDMDLTCPDCGSGYLTTEWRRLSTNPTRERSRRIAGSLQSDILDILRMGGLP